MSALDNASDSNNQGDEATSSQNEFTLVANHTDNMNNAEGNSQNTRGLQGNNYMTGSQVTDMTAKYSSAHEYACVVQQWIWQYQWLSSVNAMLPLHALYSVYWANLVPGMYVAQQPYHGVPVAQLNSINGRLHGDNIQPLVQPQPLSPGIHTQTRGHQYRIPPLWKRVVAELIDFCLLFILKLTATLAAIDQAGYLDVQKLDIEAIINNTWDSEMALTFTSELVAMEIINRIFICIFETLCLSRGMGHTMGGTTPGKCAMGLRVVSCDQVIDLPGNKVLVIPAGHIGIWNAMLRAVIKNFSMAFFFPVCLTVFFFPYNRAAYDIMAHCVVVESDADIRPLARQ